MKTALQVTASSVLSLALMGLALFLPAGTLHYWQAWVFFGMFVTVSVVYTVAAGLKHPEVLRRRMNAGPSHETRPVQKIVIAREMAREFKVLLAAQPTRGVDVGAIEFIHAQLRAARQAGKAILLVSADLTEILALSDRIAVVERGGFEQVGTPSEVYEAPATPFVAEFFGRILRFEGRMAKNGTGCRIDLVGNRGHYRA